MSQGGRSNYQIQPKVKLSKTSGKQNGYMIWIRERGRNDFRQRKGCNYNTTNLEHQAEMGKLWNELSDEDRLLYKERAKHANSNPEEVTRRRHETNRWRRDQLHRNADVFLDRRNEHYSELVRRQEFKRNQRGMAKIPEKETPWTRFPTFDEDIKIKRKADREHLKNVVTFRTLGRLENPFVTNPKKNTFQIISVFPITFLCKSQFSEVFTYPAEISIMTADLKHGIIDLKSIQVEFRPDLFYGENQEDFELDRQTRQIYTECLGVPSSGPSNALSPEQAHRWVIANTDKSYFQLCDYKQFTWVTQGLRTLSIIAGFAARKDFEEHIANRLVTIQDFAIEIIANTSCSVYEKWNEEDIEEAFLNNRLLPQSSGFYCDFHQRMDESNLSKYQCCITHNVRLLHVFLDICKENGLQTFNQHYNPTIHNLCEQKQEAVANLPMAPSIDKPQANQPVRAAEPANIYENAPIGDLHPMIRYFNRGSDIEFCREMLALYDSSSDEEEDETRRENRYNLSELQLHSTNNNQQIRQLNDGFPRIRCINNSTQNTIINSANRENNIPTTSSASASNSNSQNQNNERIPQPTRFDPPQQEPGFGNSFARELRELKLQAEDSKQYLYTPDPTRQKLKILEIFTSDKTDDFYNWIPNEDFSDAKAYNHHPAIYPRD